MKRLLPILVYLTLAVPLSVHAQKPLPARILGIDQEVSQVAIYPRKAGTSTVRMHRKGKEGVVTVDLEEIEEIRFDLSNLRPDTLNQLYMMGQYEDVIKSLAGGKIIPYFSFVDQKANSNEVIQTFIKSLYRSKNSKALLAAVGEIERYAATGDMRRFAEVYRALTVLDQGDLEAFEQFETLFENVHHLDEFAPALWYGNVRRAILNDDWKTANTYLAKIVTEAPMQTDWSGEALYLSATYHHSRTNLVVANQICQEIQIVVPLTEWPEKAATLEDEIREEAEERGVQLVEFGGVREADTDDPGEAKIDYRERQRQLKAEETERLREQLENNDGDL